MKNVTDWKTDVRNAEWIAELLQQGLLTASSIPDKARRELRKLLTYHKNLVKTCGKDLNRLQKMLERANIKLSGTVRDIKRKNARAFLSILLDGGTIDAFRVQEMYDKKKVAHNLKASNEQLADNMNGFMALFQHKLMKEAIFTLMSLASTSEILVMRKKQLLQYRILPRQQKQARMPLYPLIGTDMNHFAADAHFCAGMCPKNNESTGKRKSGKTRKGTPCWHAGCMRTLKKLAACYSRFYSRCTSSTKCRESTFPSAVC